MSGRQQGARQRPLLQLVNTDLGMTMKAPQNLVPAGFEEEYTCACPRGPEWYREEERRDR